jgi:hypothetical protein
MSSLIETAGLTDLRRDILRVVRSRWSGSTATAARSAGARWWPQPGRQAPTGAAARDLSAWRAMTSCWIWLVPS